MWFSNENAAICVSIVFTFLFDTFVYQVQEIHERTDCLSKDSISVVAQIR